MEVFFDYRKTGEKIRRCRRSKGLTQKALADAVNRTESSIQKYEKGIELSKKCKDKLLLAKEVVLAKTVDKEEK